ncbi:hypothetical protein LOK49_LG01G03588 [Camellia lanceoleosa]|uniref:Uncharacterized protein n=1 Tax=Camellia lanceoleosa TaxID=1840588 RepID=A0ACC0IZF7_9ERIC|nr:hypothetical protein LOK49_LG01G03588 [Camellia lanceoleosa]
MRSALPARPCGGVSEKKHNEARKTKKNDCLSSKKDEKLLQKRVESEQNEVYEISSGDEDYSRGMKKWITEYHQSRPGLNILQKRIDDFIIAYEEQEEQVFFLSWASLCLHLLFWWRLEEFSLAAEGGWTVVVHHKGRKKTTGTESGITVGSVAHAAALENMAKNKGKDVGLDFYRFQKREAQRNEIMTFQSKFEQDKKRIQQLRPARKFRPY